MLAVDTNILVRLIIGAVYELAHKEIATVVEDVLSHEQLSLQDAEVVSAALGQYRETPTLGFTDCLVLEIARKPHDPQVTRSANTSRKSVVTARSRPSKSCGAARS